MLSFMNRLTISVLVGLSNGREVFATLSCRKDFGEVRGLIFDFVTFFVTFFHCPPPIGHLGPFWHREYFGWSFYDQDPSNNGNNAVMRAKWTGTLSKSLYCDPSKPDCNPENTGPGTSGGINSGASIAVNVVLSIASILCIVAFI